MSYLTSPSSHENDETIIEFVNHLIATAIAKHASDIHIEPFATEYQVRLRIDGLLQMFDCLDIAIANRMVSRCKIMANVNIAESRLPQDGTLQHHFPHLDIRLNTAPTIYGEKLVLRLLYTQKKFLTLTNLGLTQEQQAILLNYLKQPHGLILVTGPTGSGKTSTLYAALSTLDHLQKNILTIEDPVEVKMHGINQSNIHTHIGLDFAALLRATLRQDPDVIMLGEIRDKDTAQIALQAAFTGHLVLATLHAQSPYAAYSRLCALGATWQDLAQSIILTINQRLLRLLCPHCKVINTGENLDRFHPKGCQHCHEGYKKRMAIFELLPISYHLQKILGSDLSLQYFKRQLTNIPRVTLLQSALKKIRSGLTTHSEVDRVLGNV